MSRLSLRVPTPSGGALAVSRLHRRQLLAGLAGAGAALAFHDRSFAQSALKGSLAYGSVGYTWALPYVAEAAGYWKDQNVELAASSFESGRDAMQALFSGSADFSASTDTPLVFAALSGLRPVAVANYSRYSRDMKIAVRSDGAIDARVPASLKGRRIATRIGTSGQYLVAKYLELAGLSASDVTIVDLAPANMATALTRGDIDAFCWSSQTLAIAQRQSGGKVVEMTLDGIERHFQSHQLVLTTETVIEKKPELIQAALRALFAAEDRIARDREWPNLIADRIKTPAADISQATSTFTFKIGFDPRFLDDLVSQAEWAIAAGLAKPPKGDLRALLRSLVIEGPTKALHPDRVTLT
ncbi:NrtA/SsuA/CpmA family ABC transporter substrate-binding protein [Bradyrhizobium sp. SSUT77]|uniref:ABC transporter substrate-binding protein n=1 Tax=Bradyrhizobium sp. SSUT77 TaxID=3040603 RepID=UPI00244C08B5|nr:NrtA/SsuA/CpmA family ABC transporter substrate-binding protein [Bradyrhizobium sp. SSUT77]MDH2344046.1 NrtA/SsuA/CpmA family ABC transporter substrate-binding protein [Bradyrhizobium sp. SSUT77]